jgi:hypothetical protein
MGVEGKTEGGNARPLRGRIVDCDYFEVVLRAKREGDNNLRQMSQQPSARAGAVPSIAVADSICERTSSSRCNTLCCMELVAWFEEHQ